MRARRDPRTLSLFVFALSPLLLAPDGCHFGASDVSLGASAAVGGSAVGGSATGGTPGDATEDPSGGEDAAGSAPLAGRAASGGSTGSAGLGGGGTSGGGTTAAGSGGGGAALAGSAGTLGGTSSAAGSSTGGAAGTYAAGTGGAMPSAGAGGAPSGLVSYWVCGMTATRTPECEEPVGGARYTFDPVAMACEERASECEAPLENVFDSLDECVENCADYAFDGPGGGPITMTAAGDPAACIVPPPAPDCDLEPESERFFFDPRTFDCQRQPCLPEGGNSFASLEDCEEACLPAFVDGALDAAAVIEGSSCAGFGEQITDSTSASTFILTGSVLSRSERWGCGCPSRAELVMVYEPVSPLRLRLCRDVFASICQQACMAELAWDLGRAFDVARTAEFVFVD